MDFFLPRGLALDFHKQTALCLSVSFAQGKIVWNSLTQFEELSPSPNQIVKNNGTFLITASLTSPHAFLLLCKVYFLITAALTLTHLLILHSCDIVPHCQLSQISRKQWTPCNYQLPSTCCSREICTFFCTKLCAHFCTKLFAHFCV